MWHLRLLLFLSLARVAAGQVSTPVPLLRPAGAVNSYLTDKQALAHKLALPALLPTTATFYFRFWTDVQVLDIWTTGGKRYAGTVTNFAQRYNSKLLRRRIQQVDTVFFKRVALDSVNSRQLAILFRTQGLERLPSDEQIPGWQPGLDVRQYYIELSQGGNYSFKSYWSPHFYADSIPAARQVQVFIDKLFDTFKLYGYYATLKLPPGSYQRDGISGVQITSKEPDKLPIYSIFDWL